jgi:hypothetical protein
MTIRVNGAGVPLSYIKGQDGGEFPIMLGRDIFNHVSDTGLARSPVDDLVSYTLGGLRVEGVPPIAVEEMCYALVVDGSAVIVGPNTGAAYLWSDTYCPNENTIHRYVRNGEGCLELVAPNGDMDAIYSVPVFTYWTKGENGWQETIETRNQSGQVEVKQGGNVPAEALQAIPNGRGNLYWAQRVWMRMEELKRDWRASMTGAALKMFLFANNTDQDSLSEAVYSSTTLVNIPDSGGRLDRPVSTAPSDSMRTEYEQLREDWFAALNTIEQDGANRPVAEDRILRMKATTQFVRRVRSLLEFIYAPFGVTLSFDRLIVQTADERLKEAELIQLVQPTDMRARLEALIP